MPKTSFIQTSSDGKTGELFVARFFQKLHWNVKDLTGIQKYRDEDIDFIVTNQDGESFRIEVKTDTRMHETGNVVVEKKMIRPTGERDGWLYKCKADYICYLSAATGAACFLDWPPLRQAVLNGAGRECLFNNWRDGCPGLIQLLSIEKNLRPGGFLKEETQIVPADELNLFHSLFRNTKIRQLALAA